jgi:hypothetical protein
LYLSDYGVNDALFLNANSATMLESREEKWAYRQDRQHLIQLGLDETARLFNHAGTHNWIKIIVSTDRFDTDALQWPTLPPPTETDSLRGSIVDDSVRQAHTGAIKGWDAMVLDVYVPNPLYHP